MNFPSDPPFPSGEQDLAFSLRALGPELGGLCVRGVIAAALMWLVQRRVGLVIARFGRLVARFRAGGLRSGLPVRVVAARVVGPRRLVGGLATGDGLGVGRVFWPRRFGWLVQLGGYRVAAVTGWLEGILGTPEMMALLVAAPQARRLLLPLCRALAVPLHLLRPGAVAVGRVDRVRVRRVRPVVVMERWPLPRGTMARARRDRALDRALAVVTFPNGGV